MLMSTEEKSIKVTFTQKLGALGYRVLCGILRVTDVRAVALLGRVIGYLVWLCSASRRRIVARNMRIVVDPRLRPDKLSSMVRRNIVRTTMNLACSLKSGIMSDREMKRSIHVVGRSDFLKSGVNGQISRGKGLCREGRGGRLRRLLCPPCRQLGDLGAHSSSVQRD